MIEKNNQNDLLQTAIKDKLAKGGRYFVLIILQVLLVVLGLCIYHKHYTHKIEIGVVNITGIAEDFIKRQSQNQLPNEELKKVVREFGNALEKEMKDLSFRKKIILMPAEAVITGAKDYTEEVRQHLPEVPKALTSTVTPVIVPKPEQSAEIAQRELAQKLNQLEEYLTARAPTDVAKSPQVANANNQNIPMPTQSTNNIEQPLVEKPNTNQSPQVVQVPQSYKQIENPEHALASGIQTPMEEQKIAAPMERK